MRWLDTVKFKNLHPAMILAAGRAEQIFHSTGADCWISSGSDGVHMEGSAHYIGRALDFRTHNLAPGLDREAIATRLRIALGPEFFVLLEDNGGDNEHLHVEYKGD